MFTIDCIKKCWQLEAGNHGEGQTISDIYGTPPPPRKMVTYHASQYLSWIFVSQYFPLLLRGEGAPEGGGGAPKRGAAGAPRPPDKRGRSMSRLCLIVQSLQLHWKTLMFTALMCTVLICTACKRTAWITGDLSACLEEGPRTFYPILGLKIFILNQVYLINFFLFHFILKEGDNCDVNFLFDVNTLIQRYRFLVLNSKSSL